jgi:hypothetical protein
VKDGTRTHFLGDSWCGASSLAQACMIFAMNKIYLLLLLPETTGVLLLGNWPTANLQDQMREMRNILCTVALAPEKDKPIWKLTKKGSSL